MISLCAPVLADNHEKPFDQVKAHRLSNIEKRDAYLSELKTCVSAAADKDAMQNSNKAHKEKLKALKEDNQEWREGMRKERESKREERKRKKN